MDYNLYCKNNKWYLIPGSKCCECKKIVEVIAVIVTEWNKSMDWSSMKVYCVNCWHHIKRRGRITEERSVVVAEPPKYARAYFPKPPMVREAPECSTFEIGKIDRIGGTTKDKTVHAGRPVETIKKLNYKHDKMIEIGEIESYLEDMR